METTIEINVDETILHNAEIYARNKNKTISDLVTDYIQSLPNQKIVGKRSNEVNSYEELVEKLDEAIDDYKNGRVVSEEVMMNKLRQFAKM